MTTHSFVGRLSTSAALALKGTVQEHSLGRVAQLGIKGIIRQTSNFSFHPLTLSVGFKVGFCMVRSVLSALHLPTGEECNDKLEQPPDSIRKLFH